MKNTIKTFKQHYIATDKVKYTLGETCPVCGVYSPYGEVCNNCLKGYDLYTPKTQYVEF